jgi:hypothetical protein
VRRTNSLGNLVESVQRCEVVADQGVLRCFHRETGTWYRRRAVFPAGQRGSGAARQGGSSGYRGSCFRPRGWWVCRFCPPAHPPVDGYPPR